MPQFSHNFNDFATQVAIGPMHYMSVAAIGNPYAESVPTNNGTVSLLSLNGRKFGITCAHVVSAYQERVRCDSQVILQVGLSSISADRIVDLDVGRDLAVLDLDGVNISGMSIPATFFEPISWPPCDIAHEGLISMSGLPGLTRVISGGRVDYKTFSATLVPIHRVDESRIIIQLNREELVFMTGSPVEALPQCLGGISGGPVFLNRETASGIMVKELIGIISEQSPPYDIFYAQRINCIGTDGRIAR